MRVKRSSILTKIVLAVLFIYALVTLVRISDRKAQARADLEELIRQESVLAAENDGMEYDIAHKDDPEVIEDIARNELGMTNPDEKIYYAGRVG